MPNLFSKGIGLAPKMGIFYSAPYKRYDCALNSPNLPIAIFLILTPCINYMAINAMQGHECNIRKCPCIARFILSGHTISHLCSLLNRKCMFEPLWHPSLPLLGAISPLLRQFHPPHSENISIDLQRQRPSTQKCHRCSVFVIFLSQRH